MKKNYFLLLILVLVITFTGCTTTNQISRISKKAIKNGEWGTPETHTLLFGIPSDNIGTSSILLQQNPDIGYNFLAPYVFETDKNILFFINIRKSRFFIYPHPVGSEFKEFSYYEQVGSSVYKYYNGIAGVDIKLTKPGLQFYGNDNEKHEEELKTLKKMVKYFKGSEWETLINSRIEEISNAK